MRVEKLGLTLSRRNALFLMSALLVFVGAVLFYSRVSNELSQEDRYYVKRFLEEANVEAIPSDPDCSTEIQFIREIQRAVLEIAAKNGGIPHGRLREPKNLYERRQGACYDRSRVIEKVLLSHGFEARHISVYAGWTSAFPSLSVFIPGSRSHAVTEVKTQRGWLIVDPNRRWVSLDENDRPVSMEMMQESSQDVRWAKSTAEDPDDIFKLPFTYVYGLHSRHGRFYPPFNPVPDIVWSEFIYNVLE